MRPTRIPLIVALLFACGANAYADTLAVVTRVLDIRGRPIVGASVYVTQWFTHDPPILLKTDASGGFKTEIAIDAGQQPTVQAVIVAKGYAIGGCEITDAGDHEVTLTRPLSVHGRVVDAKKRPACGVIVADPYMVYNGSGVNIDAPGLRKAFTTRTNAKGEYTLGGLPTNAEIQVVIDDPRYVSTWTYLKLGALATAPMIARPGIDIRGCVIGPEGKPLAGTRVGADGDNRWFVHLATTATDGSYRITSYPSGTYRMSVVFLHGDVAKWTVNPSNAGVLAAAGKVTRVPDFTLSRAGTKPD